MRQNALRPGHCGDWVWTLKLAALAAALAIAGCAKKPPETLPPTPGETSTAPMGTEGSTNAIVPGSRADFLQSVPSDRVLFETDSSTLDNSNVRRTLDAQAQWLQRYPDKRVTIEGHCDERGTREYNLALGDRRANAAKNYLASRGIDPSRMNVISWGKERPRHSAPTKAPGPRTAAR